LFRINDIYVTSKMNNFISEKELQERRKKREEEWEKVRKPGDPEGKIL